MLAAGLPALCFAIVSSRRSAYGIGLLAAAIAIPLFLKFDGSSLGLGDAIIPTGRGQTFPIGVLAVALFSAVLLLRTLMHNFRVKRSPLNTPIMVFVVWNFLALLVGLVEAPGRQNILFFLQTVVPIACFFVVLNLIGAPGSVTRVFRVLVWVMGCFSVALVGIHIASYGVVAALTQSPSGYLWAFPLYALFDYVPLVVAVGYGLGLALLLGGSRTINRPILLSFVASMLVTVLLLASRGAIATVVVITLVQVVLFIRRFRSDRPIRLLALGAGVLLIILLSGLPLVSVSKFKNAVVSGSAELSIKARLNNVRLAIRDIVTNPVTGRAYVPGIVDSQGGRHIANPHNQYLTYAVRAGLVPLLIFLWILFLVHKRLYLLVRDSASPTVAMLAIGLLSVFVGVAAVSNLFQDNFIQPYSALLLWFLMGVAEYLYLCHRRSAGQRPVDLPVAQISRPVQADAR